MSAGIVSSAVGVCDTRDGSNNNNMMPTSSTASSPYVNREIQSIGDGGTRSSRCSDTAFASGNRRGSSGRAVSFSRGAHPISASPSSVPPSPGRSMTSQGRHAVVVGVGRMSPLSLPSPPTKHRRVRAMSLEQYAMENSKNGLHSGHDVSHCRGGSLSLSPLAAGRKILLSDPVAKAQSRDAQRLNDSMVYLDGPQVYACAQCRTHLTSHDDIISKSFHGRHGRAYLFDQCVNVTIGVAEDRLLITGLHSVCDIFCKRCKNLVGWTYKRAYEASQKYKEGKYIIEKINLHLEESGSYDVAPPAGEKMDRWRRRSISWGSSTSRENALPYCTSLHPLPLSSLPRSSSNSSGRDSPMVYEYLGHTESSSSSSSTTSSTA